MPILPLPDQNWIPEPDLLRRLFQDDLRSPEVDGRYLHWDEVRRRPAPDGVSHEAWWWALSFARRQLRKPFPLEDTDSTETFGFSITDVAQRLLHEVDRDASGRIELPEDVTNPANRDRYVVNSLIEEAFRSSQLEGASTTRLAAQEMIRNKRQPRDKSERMILNNFHAMEWVRENRDNALTPELVFELQRIVTNHTLDVPDGAGRYRRSDEDVRVIDLASGDVVHTPPPAPSLPSRMAAMCAFANGTSSNKPFIHPVARAIGLHFWLAYDHPFVDGNGRTARALFYWSMLHQGYWLTEYISISRAINRARGQYEKAFIYSECSGNDATYFLFNQLKMLRTAIDDLHTYLTRKAREIRAVETKLRGREDLNNRQLALLNDALRHPDVRITIEGHQSLNRVVYQTARTDLLRLVTLGYLEKYKAGRRWHFSPVRDLERKLRP